MNLETQLEPQMNTDEHRSKRVANKSGVRRRADEVPKKKSASICVHLRFPILDKMQPLDLG
jgi:hypothetical protein